MQPILAALVEGDRNARAAEDIDALRLAFQTLSNALIEAEGLTGNPLDQPLRRMHCSMAFDFTGASWLQLEEKLFNPYFGDEMLHCGSLEHVSEAR